MEGQSDGRRDPDAEARFDALLQRLGLDSHVERVYARVTDHYSGPGRHYHNLGHVLYCLRGLDEIRMRLDAPDAAELALWFHDIVYDPARDDNELRSALLFDRELGVHLPTETADAVHGMIMATVHPSDASAVDAQFVADIDLLSMSLPWSSFRHDTETLRKECAHLTDSQFQLGTLGFFRRLIARPSIYLTDHFRSRGAAQARRNILALISEMENEEKPVVSRG